MPTYQEVYKALIEVKLHYLDLIQQPSHDNQIPRFRALATIADCFAKELKDKFGPVDGAKIQINFSLDEILEKLGNKKLETVKQYIDTVRVATITIIGTNIEYVLKDYERRRRLHAYRRT